MKRRPLSDEELIAAISSAESTAIGSVESSVSTYRADAIDRYLGRTYTGELAAPEGRSSVVSRDVADVVEGVLANVIKPFVSGDEVVSFEPLGPDDEERAQQETDYVNWIALQRNNGFLTLNAAVKDALLLRSGYVKCYWFKRSDIVVEPYERLSEEELAFILQDKDVQVVSQQEYPDPAGTSLDPMTGQAIPGPMLYDVKVRRVKPIEYVKIDAVPPEEILVSKRQQVPGLQECDFVQHRTPLMLSELRQMGYDVADDISDDDTRDTMEDYARDRESATGQRFDDDTMDKARRVVLFKESWIRIDRDGDGIAELRRVCQVGSNLLADDEADLIPIAAFCPLLMPHQHQGISVYDMIEDLAKLKTALLRQFMDNKYLSNNSRTFVDQTRVNIDDMLVSRPGGLVRVDVEGGRGISDYAQPIPVPDTGPSALQGLEYLDSIRENRTGYTRQTQGLETDALVSKTVGGMQMQLSQSQLRLEMIARTIAETGVREMFTIIHTLTLKHSTRAEKVRLKNKWVDINPREWVRRTDLSISVGLGTASQHVMMGSLMMIAQAQERAAPLGLVGPEQVYNTARKLAIAAGFKNPDEFFAPPQRDPQTGQVKPPPQSPSPQEKVEQIRQQGDAQRFQGEAQLKMKELDHAAQLKMAEQQGALALQQSNDQRQSALDQQKHQLEMAKIGADRDLQERLALHNTEANKELQIQLANIKAANALEIARIGAGLDDGSQLLQAEEKEAGYQLQEQIKQLTKVLSAPKTVTRDASGKMVVQRTLQ